MALGLRQMSKPLAMLVAAGACTALVACGGDDASSEDDGANFEDAQVEFSECMREQGIDMPDPEADGSMRIGPGDGIDLQSDEFQAAQEECEPILADAFPEGERPDPAEIRDQLHVLTECLRDRGYDVPEPQIQVMGEDPPADGGGPGELQDSLEDLQDDPEFQQAQEECREESGVDDLLPAGGPGGGE